MAIKYVYAPTARANSTSYQLNSVITVTGGTTGRRFICTTAGTTASSQPAGYATAVYGNTITDGTAVFTADIILLTRVNSTAYSNTTGAVSVILVGAGTNSRTFTCTTAGTSNTALPTTYATATDGSVITDGTAVFTADPISTVGTSWTNAYTTLTYAYGVNGGVAAGDTIYVAHDYAQAEISSISLTSPGTPSSLVRVICINRTSGVAATTATINATGTSNLVLYGSAYYYGITFSTGTGAGSAFLNVGSTTSFNSLNILESCKLQVGSTAVTSAINFITTSPTITSARIVLSNTSMQFNSTSQSALIRSRGTRLIWKNTPSAITGTVFPTTLFRSIASTSSSGINGDILLENVDLSALTSGTTIVGDSVLSARLVMKRVRLGSSVTVDASSTSNTNMTTILVNSGVASGIPRNEKYDRKGYSVQDRSVVRTGGSRDNIGLVSKKITTTAFSSWFDPFETLPWTVWNTSTGTSNTITVYGIFNSTSRPNNDEIWISADYLNSATNPEGIIVTSTIANPITANTTLTADTTSWDSSVTSRANSTIYVLNDIIKTASNPGRIFFCTTAGTSNTAEPAGYTTAVDGSVITDGTATFTAGTRFKMSTTFNAGQVGSIFLKVHAAKTSNIYYIDQNAVIT
jgi:hypothetical protein